MKARRLDSPLAHRFAAAPGSVLLALLPLFGCATGEPTVEPDVDATAAEVGEVDPGPLRRYVADPDPAYAWSLEASHPGEGYTTHVLEMTSQSWLSEDEVDRPVWTHWLVVVRPDEVRSDAALLFIGGGSNDDEAPTSASPLVVQPALATGTVTAELRMVPNQPLSFVGDDFGPRYEDALIAYGWDKFLREGEDPMWLARLPMTKAAARAMDTISAFAASGAGGEASVERFVVAGGSKRGWTTWTTAIADERVIAIAPIVIDMLNLEPSFEHHWRAYGFWAPAVGDYEREGIMEWMGAPEYRRLQEIVEPYQFRAELTLPKYLINATGDQFFISDSSQFYFDDLPGEKHLRYVPNTEHSLDGSDVAVGFLAFYQAIVEGVERPDVDWTVDGPSISARVANGHAPAEVLLWQAANPEGRDFRVDTIGRSWTSTPVEAGADGAWVGAVEEPADGWRAFYLEFSFPGPGEASFKFSTEVQVVPEDLPYEWPPAAAKEAA
jgi:PhoPQ-activated pathogenicity-related protein